MVDQTPDPTAWSDDQLDNLLDALAKRAAERDDLDLPGTGASRRGVLAGLLGLGGAAAGAGVASAIGESESYGSASGVVGTDSEPLNEANVQDLHAQDAQVDNLLEAEQARVTNVVNAKLSRSNIASNVSSGTFVNAFDTVDSDPNGFITNNGIEIFPPDTRDYRIVGGIGFTSGGSSDKIKIRVRNVDAGNTVAGFNPTNVDLTRFPSVNFSFEVELQASTSYEVQVTSSDSTFSVSDDERLTFCTVKRSLVDN